MKILKYINIRLIIIFLSISIYHTDIYTQDIKIHKTTFIENKCYSFDPLLRNNFFEIKNINRNNSGIKKNKNIGLLISKPILIECKQNSPFIALCYVLKANLISPEDIEFYYSTSSDNKKYNEWMLLETENHNDSLLFSNLAILNISAKYLQYKILIKAKSSDFVLKNIKISLIDPGTSKSELRYEDNSLVKDFKSTSLTKIIKRSEWGCPDGEQSPLWTPQYTNVSHIVIHHTAGSNNINQDYAATVRSIWSQHTYTNGWGDIGYNYLVDAYGKAYEGRAGGNNVIGAHCGYNNGTMGISVMGTYTSVLPPDTAISTLINIINWKCDDSKINPIGISWHASSGKNLNNICGHRDVKSTDCPGNTFYSILPEVREKVKTLLENKLLTENVISCYPNPFREILQLDIKHINWKNFDVEISDIYGRIIENIPINNFERGIKQLNLGNLKNGIYYLRILTPTDILYQQKIIKSK